MCNMHCRWSPSFHKSRCKNLDTLEFLAKISEDVNGMMKTEIEFQEQQQKV